MAKRIALPDTIDGWVVFIQDSHNEIAWPVYGTVDKYYAPALFEEYDEARKAERHWRIGWPKARQSRIAKAKLVIKKRRKK